MFQAVQLLLRSDAAGPTQAYTPSACPFTSISIESAGKQKDPFTVDTLLTSINYHLRDEDIVVTEVKAVSDQFHARRSAETRSYLYKIAHGCSQLPVFESKRILRVHHGLDRKVMQDAADRLVGTHDFTSFRALSCEASSPVRTLLKVDVVEHNSCDLLGLPRPANAGRLLDIIIKANGFLYHQVRIMVAFLISVGKGHHSPDDAASILEAKNRALVPNMVAAEALYFLNAEYPAELENDIAPEPISSIHAMSP